MHMQGKKIWTILFIFVLTIFMVACGTNKDENNDNPSNQEVDNDLSNNNVDEVNNDSSNDVNEPETDLDQEANQGQNDLDTTTADGYDRMTFKNLMDDVAEEKADLDDFEAVIEDPAYLNYIPYQTETIDIDVITSTMLGEEEATDDMEEFFAEHSDGNSFIRFDLDDNPIRALKVPTENVPYTSILNFSTHVINSYTGETIMVDEKEENYWLDYIISMRSEDTQNADVSEFRTWDELSNLEQTYLPIFGKTVELLYQLVVLEAAGYMDSEAAQLIMEQLALIGDETMMFPEPQTSLDYAMYNNILELKPYWSYLASYRPDDPEYKETLDKVFTFTNDAGLQLNYILWSEHEEFLGPEPYINAASGL